MDPEARVVVTARDTTGAAFASADKNVKAFARGITQLRSGLSLLGVAFSGRTLAAWASRAVQATDAVGEQRERVDEAREAFAAFQKSSDQLAESFAIRLTPAANILARAMNELRLTFAPTEAEQLDQQIERTVDEINRLAEGVIKFENGNFWQRLAGEEVWQKAREDIEQLRAELTKLYALRDSRNQVKSQVISEEELIRLETFVYELNQKPPMITQQELVALESFIYELNQREPLITQAEIDMLNDFVAELNTPQAKLPMITQDELIDLESFIYDLNNMEKEASEAAKSIGADFRDAFADWLIDGEFKFKDFLKRIAAQVAASRVFEAFGSLFAGKTGSAAGFFNDFFGGARASGGPVSAGKAYLVGERGPELFMPGQTGSIQPNGSGGVTINVDARGATDPAAVEAAVERAVAAAVAISDSRTDYKIRSRFRPQMA